MEDNIKKEKITSEIKTKNPKRVEAGKRLAMISKEAKEKKMRLKINSEQRESYSLYTNSVVTASIVLAVLSTLYYLSRKEKKDQVAQVETVPEKNNFLETL